MVVKEKEVTNYTIPDFINYGNRLHINTVVDIIVNSFAAYIVLKHSTKAMGIYKYYILSTIFFAFLLDFHLSFIYGPFAMIPHPITCSAGFIGRNLGPFWGNAIQWVTIQILFGLVGGSIMCSFFYQWSSLQGNIEFFHSAKGVILFILASMIYPLPSVLIFLTSYNQKELEILIKEEYPQIYSFYMSVPCSAAKMNALGISHYLAILIEVTLVWIMGVIIGTKIGRKIDSMKHMLSSSTLKARKQLLISLACQAIIPSGLLVAPVITIFGGILLGLVQLQVMTQLIVPLIAFHSTANALCVLYVITPYRKAIINGSRSLFGIQKKERTTIAFNTTVIETITIK